jgi:tight adherence protein C
MMISTSTTGLTSVEALDAATLSRKLSHGTGHTRATMLVHAAGVLVVLGAEQLAMLLAAGWSLTAALHRLADRGSGAVAADLRRVRVRLGQGVGEADALREWATAAAVPQLDRLVSVLALNRDTSDLARLVAAEARSIRRDVHRELLEAVERRNQSVWVPVTVATLVPGVLFLAVPFVEALRLFGS